MKVVLDDGAYVPELAHDIDAGYDIRTPVGFRVHPRNKIIIRTGIHVQLTEGTCGQIWSKSGLNMNSDIVSTGLIDEGYSGEIVVKLYNLGDTTRSFNVGDKITQLVIVKCEHPTIELVDKLDDSERGDSGFGSTGR